jgi:dimethylhistidine N-methyltransferase
VAVHRHPAGTIDRLLTGVSETAERLVESLRRDVLAGLRATPRSIPSKYLYDAAGSELFERITQLEAYYPTRTERAILEERGAEIASAAGPVPVVIEYGSGSATKTRLLLEALSGVQVYVPIDIAKDAIGDGADAIRARFPDIRVAPVLADYTASFELPPLPFGRRLAFFPGSTLGNFDHPEAMAFLRGVARTVGAGGLFLLGADLDKDPTLLIRAYDDPEGVTAAFNRNLLIRINRDLGANFDPAAFRHAARYDAEHRRIEMHLVADTPQVVTIDGERFQFNAGESIHTENAHKYRVDELEALAASTGMRMRASWTDSRGWFAVLLFEAFALTDGARE